MYFTIFFFYIFWKNLSAQGASTTGNTVFMVNMPRERHLFFAVDAHGLQIM